MGKGKANYRGLDVNQHCEAGLPKVVKTKEYVYMGTDWEIRCPCGYYRRYTWVDWGFAINRWNEQFPEEQE